MDETGFELIRTLRSILQLAHFEKGDTLTDEGVRKVIDEAEAFLKANGESDWQDDAE